MLLLKKLLQDRPKACKRCGKWYFSNFGLLQDTNSEQKHTLFANEKPKWTNLFLKQADKSMEMDDAENEKNYDTDGYPHVIEVMR